MIGLTIYAGIVGFFVGTFLVAIFKKHK